ncbi:hypothetical protein CANINC_000401 [Pichia inconspicua]|uniref:Golgi to ER traffic protein 4 n=1 Tax=Pichia inconspicua TaxID=52247 RepID=A0A4V4NG87_9ASCO|nr:hypothetical protein CANINC_000401 [[Candida] inconspicua]
MSSVENKLKKSLARFGERIDNGSYYEAQQTIRSITNRYVHSKNYEAAISLLYQSTMILLESKQYDEAADLYLYMLEVFENFSSEEFEKDGINKVVSVLSLFPDTDANLQNLAKESNKFLINKLGNPVGSPRVNFLLGTKLFNSGDKKLINQGERYLFLTQELKALDMIIEFEIKSYETEGEKDKIGIYFARVVIPYLMIKNIRFAQLSLNKMLQHFEGTFNYTNVGDLKIFETEGYNEELSKSLQLINFLQMLISLLQRGQKSDSNIFSVLLKRYQPILQSYEGLYEKINQISITYYGVSYIRKQTNMLQSMMGNLLGGK